jgi:hypothetical protein
MGTLTAASSAELQFGILLGDYQVSIQNDNAVLGLVKLTPGAEYYGNTPLYWSYKMIATHIADADPATLKITWSAQVVINTSGSSGVSHQASGTDTKTFTIADIADSPGVNIAFSAYMAVFPPGPSGPWGMTATKRHHLFRHVAYSP